MQHRPPERNQPLQNLLRRLPHHNFFSIEKRDERVWGLLDKLDEIGVDDESLIIETRKPDHFLCVCASTRCLGELVP